MHRAEILQTNLSRVEQTIAQAYAQARVKTGPVSLMAVTKYAQDEDVLTLLATGRIKHIGESRVQQAWARWTNPIFAKYPVVKHFIGHLQKNKAARAVELFDFIDSVDSLPLGEVLSTLAVKKGKCVRVLVQVKLTDKESQSGLPLAQARQLAAALKKLPGLQVCGYMAIAPQAGQPQVLRGLFAGVREAFLQDFTGAERWLSLGMSEDYAQAVLEGSTLPRIGSAIFAKNLEDL